MPSMVNGIGTTYYGKKNLQTRPGPCPQCGRAVELKSYDTRTWFVIFLIPIIPLKRLRVIDYCSACTRHFVMEVDKWESAKQLEISGALEKYRATPTPEAGMAVHQQLLNFQQLDEATAFGKLLREKYPDHAKVHAYLGGALEHFGKLDEAHTCYQRAYELRSDLPEARIGVARGYIQAGKLTEARALLDFMEKPGASQLYSLEPLDTLARALQNVGRHEEALALFALIQKELPNLNEQRWFRDLIYKSEKALKRTESQVPKQSFSWKRFFSSGETSNARALVLFGVIGALILLGFVIANEYIRRHRTVHIVNAYGEAALVQISGQGQPVMVQGLGDVTLAEGTYVATISGPVQEEVEFTVRESYWRRWFSDPAWVLNLGGAAILELSHHTYKRSDPPPPTYWFSFGEKFRRYPEVTHPFEALPDTIQVKSGQTKTLTHLEVLSGEPVNLFYYLTEQKNIPEALRLAEWRLRRQPDDDAMLLQYAQTAGAVKQSERAAKFIQAGLTNRPVQIQWHRYYQNLARSEARDAQLAAEYRAQLELEPTNSALMYLLGRVVPTRTESRLWFERACAADPRNAFALYARAYDQAALGDWAGSRVLLTQACALRPKQAEFVHQMERVRFALGEFAELEKELRAELQEHPLDYSACNRLCEVLVASGRPAEAVTYADAFRRSARSQAGARVASANHQLECHVLYLTGDFTGLRKVTAGQADDFNKYQCFIAEVEAGRVTEAIKLLPPEENSVNNPFHFLNTAIALRTAGQADEARRWYELGLAALDRGDADWKRAAAWLRSAAPKFSEHEELAIATESKATILTTLAQLHPELRGELRPLITTLNRMPAYPHHLLTTTLAKLP